MPELHSLILSLLLSFINFAPQFAGNAQRVNGSEFN